MKKNLLLTLAVMGMLTLSGAANAQTPDHLLAYGSQDDGIGSVDDDILAAMQALDEVGSLLEEKHAQHDGIDHEAVDLEELIAAANAPQSAPVKAEAKGAAKPAVAAAPKAEVKHEVQSAPVKAEAKGDTKPAVAAAPKAEVKHDVQSAPVKAEAKGDTKPAVAAAPKAEVKHEVQSAPVKAEAKGAAKPAVAAAPKAEVKHDVQSAPVKAEAKTAVASAPSIAPDGTHVTTQTQGKGAAPNVGTASSPHSLSLGYAKAVYKLNGIDLDTAGKTIAEIYQYAFSKKLVYQSTKPAIGDLVFFHNTVDRNRDGLWNDWHSLVGIVETIDNDETISVLVFMTDKVERIHLNLKYPELHKGKKGQILNSQLRNNEGAQKGISAKLFAGFANLLGDASSVTVIDNWKPGMKIK